MNILIPFILAVVTFITRIVNLLNIPIFTDEAIYIRWAQIGLNDPANRYISLTDGKQPLLTWLMYPFLLIFTDPLFAGRFVSVLSGVLAVVGLYFLTKLLFDRKSAVLSCLIYVFSPFTLLYDRLALMDSLLAALGVWSLFLTVSLSKKPKLDVSLLLGITIGLGLLTKSSASFFLYLLPFSLILYKFQAKDKIKKLLKLALFFILSILIAQIIYNSLRLSPWFYIIEQKNYSFILKFDEFLSKPFILFLPNLEGLLSILIQYLTVGIFITVVIGVILGFLKLDKRIIYLFVCFLFPFLSLASFGKVIFPRFILFMVLPLFVIVGHIVAKFIVFSKEKLKILLIVIPIIFAYPMYQSFLVIFSPVNLDIPKVDRNQLFDDWPSGFGVRDVIAYLREQSKTSKIVIGTEGTFGLNPAVYEIYFSSNKNVEIYGFWPVSEVPELLLEKSLSYPTYLIFKEKQQIPSSWPLVLIGKYKRGKGNNYLYFFQVDPKRVKNT